LRTQRPTHGTLCPSRSEHHLDAGRTSPLDDSKPMYIVIERIADLGYEWGVSDGN